MKKIVAVLALTVGLMSCNNDANDGDASTDTTNFNRGVDAGSAAPTGDTTLDMDPSTGTDTISTRSGNGDRTGSDTGTMSGGQ